MLYDNLPTSMPWYNDIKLQDRFRQNVNPNPRIVQLAPYDGVLPFQLRKNALGELPTEWKIKCAGDGNVDNYISGASVDVVAADLSAAILSCLLPENLDGFDYLTFKNSDNVTVSPLLFAGGADGLTPGVYYMTMLFSDKEWVSELFRVTEDRFEWNNPDTCNYPVFRWSHESDIDPIHYTGANNFYNLLYLDTFITASEPEFEVEGEKDGNGELIATFQKAIIKYRVSAVVPDFIKIAVFLMQMHENKYLITEKGIREGELKNIEVSGPLTSDGSFSTVELLFEQIVLIVQTACIKNMAEAECAAPVPYAATVTTAEWRTPDQSLYLKLAAFPVGNYGILYARHTGVYTVVKAYVSRAQLLAGFSMNMGQVYPYYDRVQVRLASFGCDNIGDTQEITPTLTY